MSLEDNVTLKSIARSVRVKFQSLLAQFVEEAPKDPPTHARILNESERFDAWGRNLGLFQGGHASLDYRFRDAPRVFEFARRLLRDLDDTLAVVESAIGQASGYGNQQQPSWTSDQSSNEHAAASEVSSDEEDEFLDSYQSVPITAIALGSVTDTVDRLYRLAFKIRHPGTRIGLSKASNYQNRDPETGVELFEALEPWDLAHVKKVLQELRQIQPRKRGNDELEGDATLLEDSLAQDFLARRLARANTLRRKQFAYWQKRHLKLAADYDDERPPNAALVPDSHDLKESPAVPRGDVNPSLATSVTKLEEVKVDLSDDRSTFSNITYSLIRQEPDREQVAIPELPQSFLQKKEFECPYCAEMCPRKMGRGPNWETHVLRDLRPYVCTIEDCRVGDQLFDTLQNWRSHESEHDPTPASIVDSEVRRCPLCLADGKSWMHIASHLQRIAIFALPTLLPDGDDTSQPMSASNQAAAFTDAVSDLPAVESEADFRSDNAIECGHCHSLRPAEQVRPCAGCSTTGMPVAFFCARHCSKAGCGHAEFCTMPGHQPCWVEHEKQQVGHKMFDPRPTAETITALPLTSEVHKSATMLGYLNESAGYANLVQYGTTAPTEWKSVGTLPSQYNPSSMASAAESAAASSSEEALRLEAMMDEYFQLQQKQMLEEMEMQKAQPFWNPLESMSKKDAPS